ncbi:unnamed protein product [Fraxinus pennsylvanica]|uniref:ZNF598/HEL2 C2H2 zinc finger domain-containing protein n=1 Tax=Fraxinus pennsylvanica TaxID=56036 RepID=A0AAD2DPR9_9LAMI|nr:unnamed protein product [Fraxinus pennsylvanica]
MDDTCVTCAEVLNWVAYGACRHKDVYCTCVARSRFISHDRCCSICKTPSNVVFVTKDLGEYTKRIGDFSVLPPDVEEGRVGNYWYHEGTQSFFDDSDHYKMIKAMCELSCSVCDGIDKFRRKEKFKDIEELKGHLFHKHKLFIIQFYGESELYTHMSTEHHTCRMCLRQDAGQYEYYKNFRDFENHFHTYHFLCEDEECLAKKFVVFLSEHELKVNYPTDENMHTQRSYV